MRESVKEREVVSCLGNTARWANDTEGGPVARVQDDLYYRVEAFWHLQGDDVCRIYLVAAFLEVATVT